MARARQTVREIEWMVILATSLEFDERDYRVPSERPPLVVVGGETDVSVGQYTRPETDGLLVKLTPGASAYAAARAETGAAFSDHEIAAAVIAAAIGGHPDAEEDRLGTELSALWSHHLAVVRGEDPRRIARTYAPTETKTISWRIQQMAGLGVRIHVSGPRPSEPRQ